VWCASGTPALVVSSERRSSAEADNVLPAFARDKLESDDEDDEHAAEPAAARPAG
jgi:hypothetical protein